MYIWLVGWLVVNWQYFTIDVCCFNTKIKFQMFICTCEGFKLRSRGQVFIIVQNFINSTKQLWRYCDILIFNMVAVCCLYFLNFWTAVRVRRPVCITVQNFVNITQMVVKITRYFDFAFAKFQIFGTDIWREGPYASSDQILSKSVICLPRYLV